MLSNTSMHETSCILAPTITMSLVLWMKNICIITNNNPKYQCIRPKLSMVDLQSVDMPLSIHFLKRQAWHPLRLSRPIAQSPEFWHRYGLWPRRCSFCTVRRKKPYKHSPQPVTIKRHTRELRTISQGAAVRLAEVNKSLIKSCRGQVFCLVATTKHFTKNND